MQRSTLILAAGLTLAMGLVSCDHRERVRVYSQTPEARTYAAPAPQVAAAPAPAPAPGLLDAGQLDQLLAPVALYPDPLMAQLLPAATYPDDVADAATWVKNHPEANDGDIDRQTWEPSVKALAHYPEVLQMLNDHPDWMQALGAAFLNQQDDVMASIQRLRQQAVAVKTLQDTPEQQVVVEQGAIEILPADPEVIYVPEYDPIIIYEYRPAPIFFRHHYHVGLWLDYSCDWYSHVVVIGCGWHYGLRHDGHRWRHDDAVSRGGRGGTRDGRDFARNSRDGRAVGGRDARTVATWSHNNAKPRPTLPPALTSGGISGRTRTGVTGTPNAANRVSGPLPMARTAGSQYKPFALPVREGGTSPAKAAASPRGGTGLPSQATTGLPTPRSPVASGRQTRDIGRDGRDTNRDVRDTPDIRGNAGPEATGKTTVRSNSLPLSSTIRKMPSDIPAAPPALLDKSVPARRDQAAALRNVTPAIPSRVGPAQPDIRRAPEADPRSIAVPAPRTELAPRQVNVPAPRAEATQREMTISSPKGESTRTFTSVPQLRSSQNSDSVRERAVEAPRAAEHGWTARSAGSDDARSGSSAAHGLSPANSSGRSGDSDSSRSRGSSSNDDDQGGGRDHSGRR